MYSIQTSNKFLKDLKLLKKRSNADFLLLETVIKMLAEKGAEKLDKKFRLISFREIIAVTGNVM